MVALYTSGKVERGLVWDWTNIELTHPIAKGRWVV